MKTGEISIWVSVVDHDVVDTCPPPYDSEIPSAPLANAGVRIRSLSPRGVMDRSFEPPGHAVAFEPGLRPLKGLFLEPPPPPPP